MRLYRAAASRYSKGRVGWQSRTSALRPETFFRGRGLTSQRIGPQQLQALWRGHWTIENRDPYVLDETLGEDRYQVYTGHAPQVLAVLRSAILSV